jgi:hypothetical protein
LTSATICTAGCSQSMIYSCGFWRNADALGATQEAKLF